MTSDTSPLRARMIEDMTVRGFNEHTRRDYVRHVRAYAAFIGRSPDTATAEDLRLFQLHQTRLSLRAHEISDSPLERDGFEPSVPRRNSFVSRPRRTSPVAMILCVGNSDHAVE
jgi:integrase/recombinase XerD